ncbi:MAG TPA: regulatory protein RecX [Ferruginibacter sp.]|nr:regulatory protein RecX [Ferruginibacter sp.]
MVNNPGIEKAFQKIRHYCAYQERSHFETKEKLYSLGLFKNQVEQIMATLVEENYLNEERFAIAYAGGKFRMKKWGRLKIRFALGQKRVSSYCIKKALSSIDEAAYEKTVIGLAKAKSRSLIKEKNEGVKRNKIIQYLLQKGYEYAIIQEVIKNV